MTFISIIAAVFGIVAGIVIPLDQLDKIIALIRKKEFPRKTYSERLSELTSSLTKASSEVDDILREMAQVAKEREVSVKNLEKGLADLEKREKELKENIDLLHNVPIPVAEHFARLVAPAEKRSAKRDYLLFVAGVITTTIFAFILQVVFG